MVLYAGTCKKYEEICMMLHMYAYLCKYMHYVSSNMHKHANYMLQICNLNHMQVKTRVYMHFCIYMQSICSYMHIFICNFMPLYAYTCPFRIYRLCEYNACFCIYMHRTLC